MDRIINNVYVGGADTGTGRYVCGVLQGAEAPAGECRGASGLIYCVPEGSDAEHHRSVAAKIEELGVSRVAVVSSWEVYPDGIDEVIFENSRVSPDTSYGESCASAERILTAAAREAGADIVILRPAMLFGTGVKGEGQKIFSEVVSGRYFTLRGVEARRSLVCALDVARLAVDMLGQSGIYNVSDGRPCTLAELVEAMSANTGLNKRVMVLPRKWAAVLASLCNPFPVIGELWGKKSLQFKSTARTLDTSALTQAMPGFSFYDTREVIARRDKSYPYQEE